MANETVLIVAADAASLKLAAFVLRREGYKIQISSNGEQALAALQTGAVDLMLVSTALPGMSASELAATIKQDRRTARTILVGLREPSDEASDRALLANFAGCLAKPLDPVELAHSVRDFLDAPASVTASPAAPLAPSAGADDFRRAFATDGFRQSRAMLLGLGGSFDPAQAYQTIQGWSGTARTLDFDGIAEGARAAAQALKFYPGQWSKIQGPLANLVKAFELAAANGRPALPDEIVRSLHRVQIAVIGFPRGDAERLCEALARAGAMVRLFDSSEPIESEAALDCALYLVHVRPDTSASPWFRTTGTPLPQMVLVGRIEQLLALDSAVQFGARELIVEGWRPEEVVLRLARSLSAGLPHAEPARATAEVEPVKRRGGDVLIVDDDPNVRALVKTILENQGITCRVAVNGAEGVAMAKEYAPAAALLDVNMPGMSGFEALPKIRAVSPGTKVVMLTGREQEADIVQGFSLGTDDYVVKPFIPRELVARVRRLL
jgi:DNA-binding response OmpR family regulator